MIIRNHALHTTRRTLPLDRPLVARRVVRNSPIDSFEPAAKVAAQQLAVAKSAQTLAPSSSSGGGFFSGLFSRIKNVAAGLLGQVGTWLSTNMGGYISKATSWVSNTVGGLLTKAGSWLQNIIGGWMQKLQS